MEETDNVRVT